MPRLKPKPKPDQDITIDLRRESGLAEFVRRPVASEREVKAFENALEEEYAEEFPEEFEDNEEVEESLNEIYHDDDGRAVDVQKMVIMKKRGLAFWFLTIVSVLSILSVASLYVYDLYLGSGSDSTAMDFRVLGETEVIAGQEFFYELHYQNKSNFGVRDLVLEASFPPNFVALDSQPAADNDSFSRFNIDRLSPQQSGSVKIKGMYLSPENYTGAVLAQLRYTPDNFSSEFKKEASLSTLVKDIGLDIDVDYVPQALVGNETEVRINLSAKDKSFLSSFRVSFEPSENIEIIAHKKADDQNLAEFESPRPGVWLVSDLGTELKRLPIFIRFKDKVNDKEKIILNFSKASRADEFLTFHQEELEFDVLKSDLNLTLIVNGQREDQGVDFGETLNYSIVYNNKGETKLDDVIIMAVLESEFLDWTLLNDPAAGTEKGNTIAWTSDEIAELEVVEKNQEGTIDFSLPVKARGEFEAGQKYQIKSFAQYSVGKLDEEGELTDEREDRDDNRSNTIVNRINSDLGLDEKVMYFDDNNLTVGTGPLPFEVGQATGVRVYWVLTNNLHELTDARVEAVLPEYVRWDDRTRTTVGDITYDSENNKVIWQIGRLPISVFRADGEFNITVTPREDDRGKIMVIKPGSKVVAVDAETAGAIEKTGEAKTTKLEDDSIAARNNDGVVR